MITELEVFTPRVTVAPFPVTDGSAAVDPIRVLNIDGLGPVNATVNTTQYGSVDDDFFNGASTSKRNIVITVGLNPSWVDQTVEGLRQLLYRYFMPKKPVTLRFSSTHMATVEIAGIVETCVPNIFAKDPEYQISIICPKSAFVAVNPTVIVGSVLPLSGGDATVVTYQGSLPTGFVLDVQPATGVADLDGELRVTNLNPETSLYIANVKVDATQGLELSTVNGDKYLRQIAIPGGAITSIVGDYDPGSTWIQLDEGENDFSVLAAVPGQTWTLSYFAKYGGL